ncbi:MAG: DNA polymerase/3'-5' exonuclease PolX [Myxococcota bacterium]|nr:DNA polymerase/3'-5' exonuclease PolX [Myxococcota bacterium]
MLLLGTALEMARLANVALADAGFEAAVVVGEARRGVALLRELTMITRGPGDVWAVAAALERAMACHSIAVEGSDTIRMRFGGGGPATLRVVPREQMVEALLRETGTPRHLRWLESRAKGAHGLRAACARARSEQGLYASLGLPYPAPELREGPTPRVPAVIKAVQGVFHVHTTWSDGVASIAEMARAAVEAGFGYLGLTEHSKAAIYAHGLDAERLRAQARVLSESRAEVPGFTIFHGVEVDILPDGSLDLDDATLGSLDFVVASVHLEYEMSAREMTARLIRAVSHPLVTILGHPTGRLLLGRKGYAFDVEAVAEAAVANETFLEINANPQRLDLSDALVRRAAARGARFAIDPDAHSPRGLRDTSLGLMIARRAGLGRAQVLNTLGPRAMLAYLAERRQRAVRALALSVRPA